MPPLADAGVTSLRYVWKGTFLKRRMGSVGRVVLLDCCPCLASWTNVHAAKGVKLFCVDRGRHRLTRPNMHTQVKAEVAQAGRQWCTCEAEKPKTKPSMPPSSSSSSSAAASATPPDAKSSSCVIH